MVKNATYNLKLKMNSGRHVFGQLIGPGNEPEKTVKSLKDLSYDFIMIENEHSLVDKASLFEYIRFSRKFEMPILMRPEENFSNFRCFLDAGVNGLMLPRVETVEEATRAINKAYFAPIGHRGCGLAGSKYLVDFQDLKRVPFLKILQYINNNTVLFSQTESLKGIKNLARILKLDGIMGTIVGPFDLALDIDNIDPKVSRAEAVTSDVMQSKIGQILNICKETGKVAGIGGLPAKYMAQWAREGYQLLLVGYVMDGNVDDLRPQIEELQALID